MSQRRRTQENANEDVDLEEGNTVHENNGPRMSWVRVGFSFFMSNSIMSFVEQLIDVSIGTSCGANNGECERTGKIIQGFHFAGGILHLELVLDGELEAIVHLESVSRVKVTNGYRFNYGHNG